MRSHDFDNVDDLALDGVTADNYAYYAGKLGVAGVGFALAGYFACQVGSNVFYLRSWNWFLVIVVAVTLFHCC